MSETQEKIQDCGGWWILKSWFTNSTLVVQTETSILYNSQFHLPFLSPATTRRNSPGPKQEKYIATLFFPVLFSEPSKNKLMLGQAVPFSQCGFEPSRTGELRMYKIEIPDHCTSWVSLQFETLFLHPVSHSERYFQICLTFILNIGTVFLLSRKANTLMCEEHAFWALNTQEISLCEPEKIWDGKMWGDSWVQNVLWHLWLDKKLQKKHCGLSQWWIYIFVVHTKNDRKK